MKRKTSGEFMTMESLPPFEGYKEPITSKKRARETDIPSTQKQKKEKLNHLAQELGKITSFEQAEPLERDIRTFVTLDKMMKSGTSGEEVAQCRQQLQNIRKQLQTSVEKAFTQAILPQQDIDALERELQLLDALGGAPSDERRAILLMIKEDATSFEEMIAKQCKTVTRQSTQYLRPIASLLCKRLETVAQSAQDMSNLMKIHSQLFFMLESVRKRLASDDQTQFTQIISSILKKLHTTSVMKVEPPPKISPFLEIASQYGITETQKKNIDAYIKANMEQWKKEGLDRYIKKELITPNDPTASLSIQYIAATQDVVIHLKKKWKETDSATGEVAVKSYLGRGAVKEATMSLSYNTGEPLVNCVMKLEPRDPRREQVAEDFKKEVSCAMKYLDAIGLAQVYGSFEYEVPLSTGGTVTKVNLLMKLYDKGMLNSFLQGDGARLDEKTTNTMAQEITSGSATMHKHDDVHCDIKPENSFVGTDRNKNPHLALGDFGEAKKVGEEIDALHGTPDFLPPERLISATNSFLETGSVGKSHAHPKDDAWALGCTLYELVHKTQNPCSIEARSLVELIKKEAELEKNKQPNKYPSKMSIKEMQQELESGKLQSSITPQRLNRLEQEIKNRKETLIAAQKKLLLTVDQFRTSASTSNNPLDAVIVGLLDSNPQARMTTEEASQKLTELIS